MSDVVFWVTWAASIVLPVLYYRERARKEADERRYWFQMYNARARELTARNEALAACTAERDRLRETSAAQVEAVAVVARERDQWRDVAKKQGAVLSAFATDRNTFRAHLARAKAEHAHTAETIGSLARANAQLLAFHQQDIEKAVNALEQHERRPDDGPADGEPPAGSR